MAQGEAEDDAQQQQEFCRGVLHTFMDVDLYMCQLNTAHTALLQLDYPRTSKPTPLLLVGCAVWWDWSMVPLVCVSSGSGKVHCSVCEGGLGGVRREEEDSGRAATYTVGIDGILMNPGEKPEVIFLGEAALQRDFMAFSLLSHAKGT